MLYIRSETGLMIDMLNQFSWPVSLSGYEWLKSRALGSTGEEPKQFFLSSGIPSGDPCDAKVYGPMNESGLFLKFAELSANKAAVQRFANQYGLLSEGEGVHIGNKRGTG